MLPSGPRLTALFQAASNRRTCVVALLLTIISFLTPRPACCQTIFPGTTAVGKQSAAIPVVVTMTGAGTAGAPAVLSTGIPGLDFQLTPGGTCAIGVTYSPGQQCTVNVFFAPISPGARQGAVVLTDNGVVLGRTLLSATATGPLAVLVPGQMQTIAGNSAWVYGGDGVVATAASIFLPSGVVEDSAGNIYLSDTNNQRIRRVDAATHLISTVAGNGNPGYSGDGGPAVQATVNSPTALVLDGAGDLYFADTFNHVIRRIDAVTGIITTAVGVPGVQGYSGNGGLATAATLSLPQGLVMDAVGNLYIADTGNGVVREVNTGAGTIATVAGTGTPGYGGDGGVATAAQLSSPYGVAIAPDGSLYIADTGNNRVRRVAGGTITTVVGTGAGGFAGDGGSAISAVLNGPAGMAFDPAGNLYIADSTNNRVRKVSAATRMISTLAGTDSEGYVGDGGPANLASLYGPYSLYFDSGGNLLIADLLHNRIREIVANAITLPAYATIRVGKISPPQIEGYENDGNADLLFPSSSFATFNNTALDPATTTCNAGGDLPSSIACNLGVEFAPTVTGNPVLGSLVIGSNASNTPETVYVDGQVLSVNPTAISLNSSKNPSVFGASVTFTASVSSSNTALTGTVTFFDGTTQLCNVAIASNAASCSTSTLTLGQHSITANYSGDSQDAAVNSSVLTQIVKQQSALTLGATPNPAIVAATVTLSATATASSGTPTGSVTFYDGTTALGSGNINASGVAIFTTTTLAAGTHKLSAQYSGDATDTTATSNTVSEIIQLAPSATALISSGTPEPVGTAVTFTATVTSTNGPAPTGAVTFTEGATVLGSGTLNANGVATLTLSTLAPGADPIVATYGGDANNAESASPAFTETVQQLGTVVTLSSSINPGSAGQTIVFTANTSIASGFTAYGPITGKVAFTDGANSLGLIAVDINGNAALSINTLPVGVHYITATYNGNTNYAGAASSSLSETIQITTTTTTASAAANPVLAGKPATLNATVSTAFGTPSGSITFYEGATAVGTGALNAQGTASFVTATLSTGSHTLKAVYSGDPNYTTSTSANFTLTVNLATTGLTLSGPTAPVDAGTPVNLSSTLTANGIAPTGTLTLRDGNAAIATQPVNAAGTFPFNTSSLGIGTHMLTTAYSGDTDNAAAASPAITVVVQQAGSATAFTSSANPSPLGQGITLTATITSDSPAISGTVSFEDGGVAIGTVAVSNGMAVFTTTSLAFGVHNLTAVYSGDTNHAASVSTVIIEQITEISTVNLSSSMNPAPAGTSIVFTSAIATGGGNVPTGTVVFADGGVTLGTVAVGGTGSTTFTTSALSVGSHTITASYSGDRNDAPATATLIETIQNATTQIALTASSNAATYATPETFTATIVSNGGIATGTVTFTDGGTGIGTGTLNGSGVATLALSTLTPGVHQIVANYAGDGKASASISTPLTVTVQETTSVALSSSANPAQTLAPIALTATVSNAGVGIATGTITFLDGTTTLGTAPLVAGTAALNLASLPAGNHALQATYAGDTNDFASASSALAETIQLRATYTALTSIQTNPSDPQQVTLIANVGWTGPVAPTGTVTFTTGTTIIGTVPVNASGLATTVIELKTSSESFTATYSGDTAYATSTSLVTVVNAGAVIQFSVVVSPSTMTMQSSQHGVATVTMTSVQNFTDTLDIGCLGLPFAATCTFSKSQGVLAANGTMVVQLTVDTGDPLGAGAVAKDMRGNSTGVMLCFLPFSLLACLGFKARRRSLPMLVLLLMALATTLGVTGCSGLHINSTPAGTYNFKVTASGTGTGVTVTQNMTLIVTQ